MIAEIKKKKQYKTWEISYLNPDTLVAEVKPWPHIQHHLKLNRLTFKLTLWNFTISTKYKSFFKFYFIFKLYNIVLVLPNIEMNPPQVYPCSPSWTLLPPPSPTLPLGHPSAPAPSIQYRASNLDWHHVWNEI